MRPTAAKVCCAFLMTKGKIVLFLFLIFFSCFLSCLSNEESCTISLIFSFGPAASIVAASRTSATSILCRRSCGHREPYSTRPSVQLSGFVKIVASVSAITRFPGIMKNVVSGLANVPMMGFIPLREIHRARECALQGLQRPIDSRGEANLVSPRGF